jgi:hypothetical protein
MSLEGSMLTLKGLTKEGGSQNETIRRALSDR